MTNEEFAIRMGIIVQGATEAAQQLQLIKTAAQQLTSTKIAPAVSPEVAVTGTKIAQTFKQVGEETKKTTSYLGQMGEAMKRALIVAPVWMIVRGTIQAVTRTIQDQIKFLIEFETAMARIKIVGKGTEAEYNHLQSALVNLAYTYGTTASEAAKAAVIFAQQGRTVKETIELTNAAMLASKILGTDIKTAVDDMTAAIEGFQLGIGGATSIVDKWINVEKQFAVTSKDLADATKVAGASANQLGITMSEFLGDVTAVVEVTRKSGSEAARGISFIYARLLTSGKETIEQITKIPFYLDATGKSTNTVGTQLRSVSDILGDLAGKWEALTVAEKLEIATSLGSKRQMVSLFALMQNYTASLDARIAALTSAGAAEKAFGIIQDTTTFKLNQVSTAWNVLTTAIGDTSSFKASLSLTDKMIINLAALINYEKAYGALYAREINKVQLSNETRLNEVKSLEELISVRNKLAKAPQTIENVERLKKVQDAIDVISAKESRIKVAIELGKPEELKKSIEDRLKELEMTKIRLMVSLEFEPKIAGAEKEKQDLQQKLKFTGGTDAIKLREQLAEKETEINKLYEEQSKSLDEQYKIQKGQETARQALIEGIDEEESFSTELTESEKERLSIEKELLLIRRDDANSLEKQIQKEIELTRQSKTLYEAHDKNLKIEELGVKLLDAKLQKRQQEAKTVQDLVISYDNATKAEKKNFEELIRLIQLTPEQIASAYHNEAQSRAVIEKNLSMFTEETKRQIARMVASEAGISVGNLLNPPTSLMPIAPVTPFADIMQQAQRTRYPTAEQTIYVDVGGVTGAITDTTIENLKNKIEEKMKSLPNYITNETIDKYLSDEENKRKLAQGLRQKI